jgi:hypothetical protein
LCSRLFTFLFEELIWALIVAVLEVVLVILIFWRAGEHISIFWRGGGVGNDAIDVVVAFFCLFCFPGIAFASALIARFASKKLMPADHTPIS